MPEEKRTYEVSTHSVHMLKQSPRSAKAATARSDAFPTAQSVAQGVSSSDELGGLTIPRDIIVRLIDWLKED